jgi:AcrR family transcriptional regulator
MNRRLDQREQTLQKLSQHILKEGLSKTSVRQLAKAADISDRMLLYYFEDKTDVLTSVMMRIAMGLLAELNQSMAETEKLSAGELFIRTAALAQDDAFAPYMQLALEITSAASRGQVPFEMIGKQIAEGYIMWLEARLTTKDPARRRAQAAMILAMIDGLVMLRAGTNDEMTRQAIIEMGNALN